MNQRPSANLTEDDENEWDDWITMSSALSLKERQQRCVGVVRREEDHECPGTCPRCHAPCEHPRHHDPACTCRHNHTWGEAVTTPPTEGDASA